MSDIRKYLWYLLPAIFAIIGGIISYYFLRKNAYGMAKNCLWLGIILSSLYLAYFVVFTVLIETFEFS